MDYDCGYCRASLPAIEELLAKDPKVRVVYREFPVLGPESVRRGALALAAAEQGKFRAFHDALYAGRIAERREHRGGSGKGRPRQGAGYQSEPVKAPSSRRSSPTTNWARSWR